MTSAFMGQCGPYKNYRRIQGNTSEPYVGQNVWGPIAGQAQTLYADSPGRWMVSANVAAGNTAVTTFPNTGAAYGEQPLASFATIYSSFHEAMPHNHRTSAWAAYDLWFNNWNNEVMIQHDFTSSGPCGYQAVATFGGSHGVPVQTWGLCVFGSELVWKLAPPGSTVGSSRTRNESSGTVDIKAMVAWLENHGYMPTRSTITNLSMGWEICSTGGANEDFAISSYSITARRSAR